MFSELFKLLKGIEKRTISKKKKLGKNGKLSKLFPSITKILNELNMTTRKFYIHKKEAWFQYFFLFSYPYEVEKVMFMGQIFEMKILMDLYRVFLKGLYKIVGGIADMKKNVIK